MPYSKSTQKKYGDNPLQKTSGFKMKGWSPFHQDKEGTPVDPKKVAAWQEKQKALCAAKPGHEWKEGSCWGPGEYAARQKRIADIKSPRKK